MASWALKLKITASKADSVYVDPALEISAIRGHLEESPHH